MMSMEAGLKHRLPFLSARPLIKLVIQLQRPVEVTFNFLLSLFVLL